MLLGILLTVQIIISIIMITLVLVQRSEGGALGIGGGPSGFMSARGAGNLLTKATSILGILFFANCIAMTIVGNYASRPTSAVDAVDTSGLLLPAAPTTGSAQAPVQAPAASSAAPSLNDLPLGNITPAPSTPAPASQPAPRTAPASRPAASTVAPASQANPAPAAAAPAATTPES